MEQYNQFDEVLSTHKTPQIHTKFTQNHFRMENPSKLSISSSRRLNHHMQALAEMSLVRIWIVMWIVDLGLWIVYVDCGLGGPSFLAQL